MTAEGHHGPTTGARAVLDIGPHAGALVVYTGRELAGEEIEIRPHGGAWRGMHTEVRARRVEGGVVHAGLFASLAPGHYDLRVRAARAGRITVEVTAGNVCEASWARPGTMEAAGDAGAPNSTAPNAPVSV